MESPLLASLKQFLNTVGGYFIVTAVAFFLFIIVAVD